ncbi:MAG: hypothetical protein ABI091_26895 [Ferruginibacter sp.]
MKKVTMGLLLSLISITVSASWLDGRGICGNHAYFMAHLVENNHFQFRLLSDTNTIVLEFDTEDNKTIDSLISIPIPEGMTDVKVQFRDKYNDATGHYNNWAGNQNVEPYYEMIDTTNSACKLLPIAASNVGVLKNGNTIDVSFKGGDETGTKEYQILASVNQNDWYNIKTISATGKANYDAKINLGLSAGFLIFGIALYNENKKKYSNKRKWVSFFLLAGMIVLFSCTKAKDTGTIQDYKFIKVATISNTGAAPSFSETTPIPKF